MVRFELPTVPEWEDVVYICLLTILGLFLDLGTLSSVFATVGLEQREDLTALRVWRVNVAVYSAKLLFAQAGLAARVGVVVWGIAQYLEDLPLQ